ncbi:MAG: hypothetical protein AAF558_12715 [Verrucomicrobiota bacterium]
MNQLYAVSHHICSKPLTIVIEFLDGFLGMSRADHIDWIHHGFQK